MSVRSIAKSGSKVVFLVLGFYTLVSLICLPSASPSYRIVFATILPAEVDGPREANLLM